MNKALLAQALLRKDPEVFLQQCFRHLHGAEMLRNWHILAMIDVLERVRRGEITRLIINLPPRYLKSLLVSVAFPAFLLGHDPRCKIHCLSYSDDLALMHARDARSVMTAPWYLEAFPPLKIVRNVDNEIRTSLHGYRKAGSVLGTVTGRGGSHFIIDDPLKGNDAFSDVTRYRLNHLFSNTLRSRLDNKEKGVFIIVMQRLHLHDLSGYLTELNQGWTVLDLPAIAEIAEDIAIGNGRVYSRQIGEALHPQYESLATLQQLRNEMGPEIFAAQYQQRPVPTGGSMFKKSQFRYYDVAPDRTGMFEIIQSWDTASKNGLQNDFSVCTTWLVKDNNYYLLDLQRGRYDYPELKAMAIRLAQHYKPQTILIEDASTGTPLAQEFRSVYLAGRITLVPANQDKRVRAYVQVGKFESGLVHFPRNAPYLAELEAELLSFPQSRHDDQVDSLCQALAHERCGYTLAGIR